MLRVRVVVVSRHIDYFQRRFQFDNRRLDFSVLDHLKKTYTHVYPLYFYKTIEFFTIIRVY